MARPPLGVLRLGTLRLMVALLDRSAAIQEVRTDETLKGVAGVIKEP